MRLPLQLEIELKETFIMQESGNLANISPEKPPRLLRLNEVRMRVGLGRSTIYRWISEGYFPKPIKLGYHSVGWLESEIDLWISSRSKFGHHTGQGRSVE
jgi:prophage regulatory protein